MSNIAVILPIPLLSKNLVYSNYHLCLASFVLQSSEYRRYYAERSQEGHLVILDNMAHENGVGEPPDILEAAAWFVHPSEIVLPDALFDWEQTVERSRQAYPRLRDLEIPLMVVPQGKNFDEWKRCLDELLKLSPSTIGISKDFEVWDLWGLVPLIDYAKQFNLPIHLLGWGRRLHLLPYYVDAGGSLIRGVDSAKPAVYAAAGARLPEDLTLAPPYPGRPEGFFFNPPEIDLDVLDHNVRIFEEAARGQTSR